MMRSLTHLALVSVLALGWAAAATPAHAAGLLDAMCSGTAMKTFAPGLLDAPQTVTATNDRIYAQCVSASDPSVISGSDSHVSTNTRSCNEVSAGPDTGTFDWANGRSSTFAFNRMTTRVAGTDTLEETGTITAGAVELGCPGCGRDALR
jgi:hypothetical protein